MGCHGKMNVLVVTDRNEQRWFLVVCNKAWRGCKGEVEEDMNFPANTAVKGAKQNIEIILDI